MKWMQFLSVAAIAAMTLVGCQTKYETDRTNRGGYSGGNGGNGGGTVQPVNQPTVHNDWTIRYMGRTSTVENGKNLYSEVFNFGYKGDNYFIFRTLTAQDFQNLYKSDLKAFLEGEVKDVITMADNMKKKFYETDLVFKKDVTEVLFDILISGSYDGYIIEIGQDGKPTYGYAKLSFRVEKDPNPLEEYLAWIGTWHLTDGYVGYDITITERERNYLYRVDGWETGDAVSTQMNGTDDWLEARFNQQDGKLYFYGQYIQTEFDEGLNTDVEEYFVGTYLTATSDKNGEVDAEGARYGWDIAYMMADEKGNVTLNPEMLLFENDFQAPIHSMRFSRYCLDEFNWAHYNQGGVPTFKNGPITMIKTKADVAAPEKIVVARRRTQPKVQKASSVRTYPAVR